MHILALDTGLGLLCTGEANGTGRRPSDADELGGSALRLLHQLAHSQRAAEALARASPPAVSTLLAATRCIFKCRISLSGQLQTLSGIPVLFVQSAIDSASWLAVPSPINFYYAATWSFGDIM